MFNSNLNVEHEYSQLAENTLRLWNQNPGSGDFQELPDGYWKFGISTGSYFQIPKLLQPLIDAIENIRQLDANLVTIPSGCHHFTFLALAGHEFDEFQSLPKEIFDLKNLCDRFLNFPIWQLDSLRLLPGPNFLLLVGTPTPELIALRERFAAELLVSPWRTYILNRHEYKGYPFPPRIWHTTLCRYKAQFLPESLRQLYHEFKDQRFGSIHLEPPLLRRVNYDWSVTSLVRG